MLTQNRKAHESFFAALFMIFRAPESDKSELLSIIQILHQISADCNRFIRRQLGVFMPLSQFFKNRRKRNVNRYAGDEKMV